MAYHKTPRSRMPDITDLREDVKTTGHRRKTTLSLQLQRAEHRNRVLGLIRNGASPDQVSELLREGSPPVDLTPQEVTQFVKNYLNRVHTEDALTIEQLRVLENERLDVLWRQLMAHARNGDGTPNLRVIDRLTRLSERRSKMNGIEAAQKHELTVLNGLEVLGIEAELLERGQQAWLESGEITDAEVVE